MDKLAGLIINSLAFAREERSSAGVVAPGELPRLRDELAEDGRQGGRLEWRVVGGRNLQGKLFLDVKVEGELHLTCQRCLGVLPYGIKVEGRVLLVPPGAPWPDETLEDDSADAIEALAEQPVMTLIEDEVLLALPVAPRHPACQLPAGSSTDSDVETPFQNLARLRQQTSH
jgi:uncharacterized protein